MPFNRLHYHLTHGRNDKKKYSILVIIILFIGDSLHFPPISNHLVHKRQKYCIRKEGGNVDLLAEIIATLASQNNDVK